MSRSFLARFRGGADAHSLARALALLVAINAIFGGFHAGRMAEAGLSGTVICTLDGAERATPAPSAPAGAADLSCCLLGLGPLAAGLPEAHAPIFGAAFTDAAIPLLDRIASGKRLPGSASPRGPPRLA